MRRYLACVAIMLVGGCGVLTPQPAGHPPIVLTCEEDMPCWDCETMGNGICGLTPTENEAELLESTTHNGQESS